MKTFKASRTYFGLRLDTKKYTVLHTYLEIYRKMILIFFICRKINENTCYVLNQVLKLYP